MIVHPPEVNNNWFSIVQKQGFLDDFMPLFKVIDDKGRYLHWDELRHRIGNKDHTLVWSAVKSARMPGSQMLSGIPFSTKDEIPTVNIIPSISRRCSFVDNWCSGPAFNAMLGALAAHEYFIEDLVEEESIASSQLEGASTTRRVAKEMLQSKREPRNPDEKMIFGNFKMMQFAWTNRDKNLSLSLIKELHSIGTEGIDDEKYTPGTFRTDNSVYVSDNKGDVLHQPPSCDKIDARLSILCDWGNIDHSSLNTKDYIHPLVKAIILHFSIGYEHPFNDGNGRVARALFYWHMFKYGYKSFKYISISKLFKKDPIKYGKSYLYTESDKYDLTYFIDYQCQVIEKVASDFVDYIQSTINERNNFNMWLFNTRISNNLNDRQRAVLQTMGDKCKKAFTTKYLEEAYGVSNNTARKDLAGLVKLGFLKENKTGKPITFTGALGYSDLKALRSTIVDTY
ncbi:MAG: hypothetical protein OFPII_18160 [Osedax symbiont Rs1]|nr:MAG: hypothetical protein OFPII_18160 [Osedax symbiont Rs1]